MKLDAKALDAAETFIEARRFGENYSGMGRDLAEGAITAYLSAQEASPPAGETSELVEVLLDQSSCDAHNLRTINQNWLDKAASALTALERRAETAERQLAEALAASPPVAWIDRLLLRSMRNPSVAELTCRVHNTRIDDNSVPLYASPVREDEGRDAIRERDALLIEWARLVEACRLRLNGKAHDIEELSMSLDYGTLMNALVRRRARALSTATEEKGDLGRTALATQRAK